MSKYKKGDMFVVEITGNNCKVGLGDFKCCLNDVTYVTEEMLDKFTRIVNGPYNEDYLAGYAKGLKDAWEVARKIGGAVEDGGYTGEQLANIFGSANYQTAFELSAETAIEKIKAYEEKQNKIRVGDVVKRKNGGETMIVTKITVRTTFCGDITTIDGVKENGQICSGDNMNWEKTGRHYPEIEKLFGDDED